MVQDISYTIIDPNEEITAGKLCVVVKADTVEWKSGNVITPDHGSYIGVGISSKEDASGRFTIEIEGRNFKFNRRGGAASPETYGFVCYLVDSNKVPIEVGTVVGDMKSKTITRNTDGSTDYSEGDNVSIAINNLNARDQFALKVLQGFMAHIDNPASLGPNEMSYYTDKAYQWASYLMTTAADTRASIKNEESSTSKERDINPEDLTSNTEILLNNLIAELKNSDLVEVEEDKEVTSKLVTLKQLSELINSITSLTTEIGSKMEESNTILDKQADSAKSTIGLLQGIVESLNNINVKVTYTE